MTSELIQTLAINLGGPGGVGLISIYVIRRLLDLLEAERVRNDRLLRAMAEGERREYPRDGTDA